MYKVLILSLLFFVPLFAQETEVNAIEMGDNAYEAQNNNEALKHYLKALDSEPNSYEANWKASRSYMDLAEGSTNEEQQKGYYHQAQKHANNAIHINEKGSNGHLYLSMALGKVALAASAKQRIKMSKQIKKEADLAIKYNNQNDIAHHVLGRWNRKISNLSFIERGFANAFLGGVPENASNEQAVTHFKTAIQINPEYINHYLELGITYEVMDEEEKAIAILKKCIELKPQKEIDKKYQATAKELLEDLE